jgi:hypothetical protein
MAKLLNKELGIKNEKVGPWVSSKIPEEWDFLFLNF